MCIIKYTHRAVSPFARLFQCLFLMLYYTIDLETDLFLRVYGEYGGPCPYIHEANGQPHHVHILLYRNSLK